ncbi:Callose synthase 7 [Camellia lanceoleosa]|uniref:Callose synthase 7 n=1 Tax=Camellia lanceoleosa TaxID=1840588 RepID=A0ACC0I005_9ERIC|nr:Callose synthase 7 [Camellia lanceoleosa]
MYYRKALELQCFLDYADDRDILSGYWTCDSHKDLREGSQALADLKYPSLRVAYIDEKKEPVDGKRWKNYYSILVKGGEKLDEEIYRIKLPGPPTEIGEGKPENQNHAIIFTRGEALQTIDMNQDNYLEEAFKMRNVLEELLKTHNGR